MLRTCISLKTAGANVCAHFSRFDLLAGVVYGPADRGTQDNLIAIQRASRAKHFRKKQDQ
jgi:hypothetical protein